MRAKRLAAPRIQTVDGRGQSARMHSAFSANFHESGGSSMSTAAEPKLVFPALRGFYDFVADLWYPLIRVAVGGVLFVHGAAKLKAGVSAVAAGALAKRGIEPALPLAYFIMFLETAGAICIAIGLFTRPIAAALAIEFAVIVFVAHWPAGFWAGAGGYEYPLLWGLVILAIALRGGGPWSVDRALGWEV